MAECPHCGATLVTTDDVCAECRDKVKNLDTAKANEPKLTQRTVAEVAKRVEEERRGTPRKLILMGLLLFVGGLLSLLVWVYLPAVFWLPIWIVATVAAILGVVSLVSGLALFVSDRFWFPMRARKSWSPSGCDPAGAAHRDRDQAVPAPASHRSPVSRSRASWPVASASRRGHVVARPQSGRCWSTGIATTPFPPRVPPFARVEFTGVVANGPGFATWAT